MNKSRSGLLLAMLIYALIFVLLLIAGLFFFRSYLTAYELSRPVNVVQLYHRSMTDADIDALSEELISQLDPQLVSVERTREYIRSLVAEGELVKSHDASAGNEIVYYLRNGELILGKLVLRPQGEDRFGFPEYAVTPTDFDFSALCREQELTVPEDWTVLSGGTPLGPERIVREGVPYMLLEEFYDEPELRLPHLTTYSTGLYLLEPELHVRDSQGREVTGALNEDRFADNCGSAERDAIIDLAGRFVSAYVTYSSNANQNIYGNLASLLTMVVPDSTLEARLRGAVSGLSWSSTMSDELQSIVYHHIMSLGDGHYLCDLTYTNDTLGWHSAGVVTTTNNLKLIIEDNSDQLLVSTMSSY